VACLEEKLPVKMPTKAEDLVDVRRMDVFGDGHGDLVLSYGLASNPVWVFKADVDEVDFIGGSFFEEIEDADDVQGATLMAAVARCEVTVLCKNEVSYALSHAEPEVEGCSVKGAGYVPKMLEATESVGLMPCNALSMPEEAAVIAVVCDVVQGCAELKAEAPAVGWVKGNVWEMQTLLLPETEGMEPCQVGDISFVESP